MNLIALIKDFCNKLKKLLTFDEYADEISTEGNDLNSNENDELNKLSYIESNERINSFTGKNSLIDDINFIRTKLSRIEVVCPVDVAKFNVKLDNLENECKAEYKKYIDSLNSDSLVFACNPIYNSQLIGKIRDIQNEIDNFISTEAQYKLLAERFGKMYSELCKYYKQFVNGSFNGSFDKCIEQAKQKMDELIERIFGKDNNYFNVSNDYLKSKTIRDTYENICYIIYKCILRFKIKNNLSYELKEGFRSEYLIPLMSDLNSIKKQIETFKQTEKYDKLISKYNKLKTFNISNIESFIKNNGFFELLFSIEDLLFKNVDDEKAKKVKQLTNELLDIFLSKNKNKGEN